MHIFHRRGTETKREREQNKDNFDFDNIFFSNSLILFQTLTLVNMKGDEDHIMCVSMFKFKKFDI